MQPLLSSVTNGPPSPDFPITAPRRRLRPTWFRRQRAFPKSKGALIILVWNLIVGFTYGALQIGIVASSAMYSGPLHFTMYIILGGFAMIAFFQLLAYPVGGLLADLCCGRLRVVSLSIFKIWLGTALLSIVCIIYISNDFKEEEARPYIIALMLAAFILFAAGFTGFQANAVQFGLDQLLDAPSEELSVFLHWYMWTQDLGELLARLVGSALPCSYIVFNKVLPCVPLVCVLTTGFILIFSYCKQKWLHCEPCARNPYGTVYRVLKFVAQHKQPIGPRTAFAYCDDEIPTRMEFAKQRFGGPYTTETVEDVKTFLRILAMLLLITPFFNLHIASAYIFPLYAIHLGSHSIDFTEGCTPEWILLQSGNCNYMVSVIFLPLYIVFIHPLVPRWLPRILHRLLLGVVLIVATVAIMLGLLAAAKAVAIHSEGGSNATCLFLAEIRDGIVKDTSSSHLNFYTPVLVVPSVLTGITIPLIYITILEFISAQSPHTMKGLLLGAFYAFRGLFVMLGCFFVVPFTQPHWWAHTKGSVYDCGFSYYLTSTALGVVGIVTVSVGIKWYHYRKRQDRPYGPCYVEDYYYRYGRHATTTVTSAEQEEEEEEDGQLHVEINSSILAYGTMDGT